MNWTLTPQSLLHPHPPPALGKEQSAPSLSLHTGARRPHSHRLSAHFAPSVVRVLHLYRELGQQPKRRTPCPPSRVTTAQKGLPGSTACLQGRGRRDKAPGPGAQMHRDRALSGQGSCFLPNVSPPCLAFLSSRVANVCSFECWGASLKSLL